MTVVWQLALIVQQVLFVFEDEEFDADKVTPGVGGFAVVAIMALAIFALGFDLVRRLRRSRYRHEIRAEIEAELAERAAGENEDDVPADPRPGS